MERISRLRSMILLLIFSCVLMLYAGRLYFLQIILHKFSMKKYNIDPNYTKFMTEDHKK